MSLTEMSSRSVVGGSVLGFPKSIKSREKLSEYLTVVIFTASAQHAAVNFGQVGQASPFWGRVLGTSQWEPPPIPHPWPRLLPYWSSHLHAASEPGTSSSRHEAPTRLGQLEVLEKEGKGLRREVWGPWKKGKVGNKGGGH